MLDTAGPASSTVVYDDADYANHRDTNSLLAEEKRARELFRAQGLFREYLTISYWASQLCLAVGSSWASAEPGRDAPVG